MHWSLTKLLHRGAHLTPRVQGNAPKHKWSLPPQKRCVLPSALPFEHNFPSKLAGRKKGEKASCGKKKGLTLFKALPQGKGKPNEQSFPNWPFLIPTLPLLLKWWCWLCIPAVENYTGSVTSLSPLLEHQYRAAHGERKTSTERKTVAWEYLVAALSLNIKNQKCYPKASELAPVK